MLIQVLVQNHSKFFNHIEKSDGDSFYVIMGFKAKQVCLHYNYRKCGATHKRFEKVCDCSSLASDD